MKPKPTHCLLAIAAILILCGCEESKQKTYVGNSKTIWVDTINIHGKSHEILIREKIYRNGGVGGMIHSPECWCGKEDGRIN